nr:Tn3 family transposase [Micromonospora coriariae]
MADGTYRRRIARQLNKGENVHALRRSLAYAGEGALRRRHHEQQTERAPALGDICPDTGRGRLSYPRAEYLFRQASKLHDRTAPCTPCTRCATPG